MTLTNLNSIVNNVLNRRKYSIHFFLEFLIYASDCLRELSMDDLKVVQAKKLSVNEYNAVDLPNDYLDYVKVGVEVGQNVRPLVETSGLNRMVNRDADFNPIPYYNPQKGNTNPIQYGYLNPINWWGVNFNEYGEFTGRQFGAGAGVQTDVFTVVKERNQIQLTDHLTGLETIVLEYISNGQSADAATQIDSYAIATIEAYILWQMKESTRTYSEGERERAKQEYITQRQILRARMSDLTMEKIKRIIAENTYLAPKHG